MAKEFDFKSIEFPLGGLNRRWSLQRQPDYTTPDALNVWPFTRRDMRLRGGSRPGTSAWASNGTGGRVNMLTSLNGSRYRFVPGEESGVDGADGMVDKWVLASFFDDFSGDEIKPWWESAFGNPLPDVSSTPPNGMYHAPVSAVRTRLSYSQSDPITVSMSVASTSGHSDNGRYSLMCGLRDTSPSTSGGVMATLVKSSDGMSVEVSVNGSVVHSGEVEGSRGGSLEITLNADGSSVVGYGGARVCETEAAVMPGTRIGFTLEAVDEGGVAAIDSIGMTYYESIESWPPEDYDGQPGRFVLDKYADILVAGSGGDIWYSEESSSGRRVRKVETSVKTRQTGYVMAQKRLRELFVADYGEYLGIGTDGSVASGKLGAASVSDWGTLGIVAGSDVAVISNASSGVVQGAYVVESVEADGVTLRGYSGSDGTCAWSVCVSPKVYDHGQKSYVPMVATQGMVPVNCPIVCLYRDRLVLAGAASEPHLWYMSRAGDPYDWSYAIDTSVDGNDVGVAVAGQSSLAGTIGEPIRALCPHSDDYLVFGYDRELWVLRGDPADGGQLDNLSRTVGIVGRRAWCYGDSGEIVFLAKDGVYSLTGANGVPQVVSRAKLPDELMGMGESDNVQMVYDAEFHGVHVYSGQSRHWFVSLDTGGMFPMSFSSGMVPTAVYSYGGKVILGCEDGLLRSFFRELGDDDGKPMESSVVLGPFRVFAGDYSNGVVQRICVSMDVGGEAMSLRVVSADEAFELESRLGSGRYDRVTFARGVDTLLVRERGGAMCLVVSRTGHEAWGMERIGLYVRRAGRMR